MYMRSRCLYPVRTRPTLCLVHYEIPGKGRWSMHGWSRFADIQPSTGLYYNTINIHMVTFIYIMFKILPCLSSAVSTHISR